MQGGGWKWPAVSVAFAGQIISKLILLEPEKANLQIHGA
jgi:hypothetical protein